MATFVERRLPTNEGLAVPRNAVGKGLERKAKELAEKVRGFVRHNDSAGISAAQLSHSDSGADPRITNIPPGERIIGVNYGIVPLDPDNRDSGSEGVKRASWSHEQKVNQEYKFREVREEDLDVMIEDEWFKDKERAGHLWGDTINENTLPRNWDNPEEVAKFKDVLHKFYFPDGPFVISATIPAKRGEGSLTRNALVVRKTRVVEKDGVLAGATSWLEGVAIDRQGKAVPNLKGDPWANDEEYKTGKQSHTQMHVVSPRFEHLGIGIGLLIDRTEQIFDAGYNKIVTWVNHVPGYEPVETLFESVGYTEDRGKEGRIYTNPTVPGGVKVEMKRFVLDKALYEAGGTRQVGFRMVEIGREAAIQRWEERIQGIGIRKRS